MLVRAEEQSNPSAQAWEAVSWGHSTVQNRAEPGDPAVVPELSVVRALRRWASDGLCPGGLAIEGGEGAGK